MKKVFRGSFVFSYLQGRAISHFADSVVVLVQGIGYRVFVTSAGLENSRKNSDVSLWIEPIMRENQWHLFGFLTQEEHTWFGWLLNVPGVGPKVALNILSLFPISELCECILQGQVNLLKQAEGVGLKVATRVVNELKDKAKSMGSLLAPLEKRDSLYPFEKDVRMALENLGYKKHQLEQAWSCFALEDAQDILTIEDCLKKMLQYLSKNSSP